jgi:hypothetical protein
MPGIRTGMGPAAADCAWLGALVSTGIDGDDATGAANCGTGEGVGAAGVGVAISFASSAMRSSDFSAGSGICCGLAGGINMSRMDGCDPCSAPADATPRHHINAPEL